MVYELYIIKGIALRYASVLKSVALLYVLILKSVAVLLRAFEIDAVIFLRENNDKKRY